MVLIKKEAYQEHKPLTIFTSVHNQKNSEALQYHEI